MSDQELRDKTNSIWSSVIDLIAEDAEFRAALEYDPAEAMRTAGFAGQLDGDLLEDAEDEVVGFAHFVPMFGLTSPSVQSTTPVSPTKTAEGSIAENRYLSYTWETSGSCTVRT